jgi:hypothetical protein
MRMIAEDIALERVKALFRFELKRRSKSATGRTRITARYSQGKFQH